MRPAWAIACVLLALGARAEPWPGQTPTPSANYYAARYHWGSQWGGVLDAILGGAVALDASSSQPKGFVSKLHDGDAGDLADPTGSFLIFDGPRAALRLRVPAWREIDRVSLFALERAGASGASVSISFADAHGQSRAVPLARRVLETRAGLARVEYRGGNTPLALSDGELRVAYENRDLGSAFLSEIAVDGLGNRADPGFDARPGAPSRLLFWQAAKTPSGAALHSLIVRSAASGDKDQDLVAAWLALPAAGRPGPLPLVVVMNDPAEPYPALELLGFAGRPEHALAPALLQAGLAALVVNLPRETAKRPWDAKSLRRRVDAVVAQALGEGLARHAGVRFDRLGIWAPGRAAAIAADIAGDPRYAALALSRPSTVAALPAGRPVLVAAPRAALEPLQGREGVEIAAMPYEEFTDADRRAVVGFFRSRLDGPAAAR